MFLLLIAGIGCLALCAFEAMRTRTVVERERSKALKSVRTMSGAAVGASPSNPRSLVGAQDAPRLATSHRRVWRRQTDDGIVTELACAGASRRWSAELFMAARVALT